ncbi:hypothetical protein N656DRAFT_604830 [Canariomyces notabilis]|uniref:Uncharacterized protein n=1 Tax=Canariomyces notabilis TaxID=2074819 RepID=A0AAN6YU53_9PEZI|nr:hypothetical protein N656DRAFT_604830 [Canariomyces arenarius]
MTSNCYRTLGATHHPLSPAYLLCGCVDIVCERLVVQYSVSCSIFRDMVYSNTDLSVLTKWDHSGHIRKWAAPDCSRSRLDFLLQQKARKRPPEKGPYLITDRDHVLHIFHPNLPQQKLRLGDNNSTTRIFSYSSRPSIWRLARRCHFLLGNRHLALCRCWGQLASAGQ